MTVTTVFTAKTEEEAMTVAHLLLSCAIPFKVKTNVEKGTYTFKFSSSLSFLTTFGNKMSNFNHATKSAS